MKQRNKYFTQHFWMKGKIQFFPFLRFALVLIIMNWTSAARGSIMPGTNSELLFLITSRFHVCSTVLRMGIGILKADININLKRTRMVL